MLHCVADNDDQNDPQAKMTLREAYDSAGIDAEIEVYSGAFMAGVRLIRRFTIWIRLRKPGPDC